MRSCPGPAIVVLLASLSSSILLAQNIFRASRDHAAIQYSSRPTRDAVARLNQRLEKGELKLSSEAPRGYLKSVLTALDISTSSQTLVFSENSLQRSHISKATPRAIYFNDHVMVAWANGADTIEAAAHDPGQGVIFYSIPQKGPTPRFVRRAECLQCHLTSETSGVPGLFMMSVLPLSDNQNEYARGWAMDHRTPIDDRWGGWYVTGAQVPSRHLGNVAVSHVPKSYVRAEIAPKLTTGTGTFDTAPYLTPYSDVAALMVLNHQLHAMNLMTRLGWESRIAAHDSSKAAGGTVKPSDVRDTARELVDYLLFVDEAPLATPVQGSSPFAQEFAKRGPRDSKGRSLRDLDLAKRLFRYPCSYMIYTEAFDALPADARAMVYERMWEILSGRESDKVYYILSVADRRAIVEILRETKKGLPDYFQTIVK
jgi:hypothetical protein